MSESLGHAEADIVRHLFIALGIGTHPDDNDDWPVFASQEPNLPDNCITVYRTVGTHDGRIQVTGEVMRHLAFMARIRATLYEIGDVKANETARILNEELLNEDITIQDYEGTGTTSYRIHSAKLDGHVNTLGKMPDNSERELFTLNYLYTLTKL